MSNNHVQVAHAWAHQTGRQTRGFNMYYDGATIYSYGSHFPIARHVTLPDGSPAVLMTTQGWSVSTSKHKSIVRGAIRHLRVICAENVNASRPEEHAANRATMVENASTLIERAKRARTNGPWLLEQAVAHVANANDYARAFALDVPELTIESLGVEMAAIVERIEAARVAERERQAAREAARFAEQEEARVEWLAGGTRYFHGHDGRGNALLRVKGDELETSLGAAVPLSHAVRVFRFLKLCRERAETWKRNGRTIRVGHFHVDHVAADGSFQAGCHSIVWSEVERIARQLGIFDETGSADAVGYSDATAA